MSQADELLNSLTDKEIDLYTVNPETEEHIVIDDNRYITVPEPLKRIAVQYDHNVETVTFDCPRYWDEHDLSTMYIYINYLRLDRNRGRCLAKNVRVDENDSNLIHFEWTIGNEITIVNGGLTFLVCALQTDSEGNEELHWNSEINNQMFVSTGLECTDAVIEEYPDIINDLLFRMDTLIAADTPILDTSLNQSGFAADAKVTGDALRTETTERQNADSTILNALSTETTMRENADDDLKQILDKKPYCFDDTSTMQSADLEVGDYVITSGYYSKNDGRGATYSVVSSKPTTLNKYVSLDNGSYAVPVKVINDDYYNEVTYTKERYYDTDCYFINIPKYDNNNELIMPSIERDETLTPLQHAQKEHTTFTCNGTCYITDTVDSSKSATPIVISKGVIINNKPMISEGVADNYLYLGITKDREIKEYKVNETTADTMINDGCLEVFNIYYKLIENKKSLDLTNVVTNESTVVNNSNPRLALGLKADGSMLFFACDGRTSINKGLTSVEMQQLLIEKGCIEAWNMDGGGSTSVSLKGSKLNRNIDSNGTADRKLYHTFNIKKNIHDTSVADAFSKIGEEKQNIIAQLVPLINHLQGEIDDISVQDISGKDLNTLIGKYYIGYGNGCVNRPKDAGYFINIPHSQERYTNLYNKQIYFVRDTYEIFIRSQIAGEFNEWVKIGRQKIFVYTPSSINVIAENSVYQNLKFNKIDTSNGSTINLDSNTYDETEDTYAGLTIDKSMYTTVKFDGVLKTNTAGEKFFRIIEEGATDPIAMTRVTVKMEEPADTYIPIHLEGFAKFPIGAKIRIQMFGQAGDTLYRGYIFAEVEM